MQAKVLERYYDQGRNGSDLNVHYPVTIPGQDVDSETRHIREAALRKGANDVEIEIHLTVPAAGS